MADAGRRFFVSTARGKPAGFSLFGVDLVHTKPHNKDMKNEATTNDTNSRGRETMSDNNAATISYTINDQAGDGHEFCISHGELQDEPERTAYDVSQAIHQDLNGKPWDAVIKVRIQGENPSSPRLTFEFINGGRGWEARSTFGTWLYQSLSMMTEHDTEHGPISNESNRASTLSGQKRHGRIR